MDIHDQDHAPAMSRTAILPCWSGLALLAVALAAVALLLTRCSRGRAEYEHRIAALRAAGEPVTAADFGALYPDPPPDKDFRRLLRLALPVGTLDPNADPYVEVGPACARMRALANRAPFAPELLEQVRLELLSNAAPVARHAGRTGPGVSYRRAAGSLRWAAGALQEVAGGLCGLFRGLGLDRSRRTIRLCHHADCRAIKPLALDPLSQTQSPALPAQDSSRAGGATFDASLKPR